MRKVTMRTAELDKNTVLKISNRTGETQNLPYGSTIYSYGDIEEIDCCLLPLDSVYQAQAYGVTFIGTKKAVLTIEQGEKFNMFTHIWIDSTPDTDKQNSEYVVKYCKKVLTNYLLVISKVQGN